MQRTIIILMLSLLLAGCNKNNPVSPIASTNQSDNLEVTMSIPKLSYGINDTLEATTTAFNPGDTIVNFYIPDCWPIAWYSVQDMNGITRLSYTAPKNYGCNSVIMYSILPHQSKKIFILNVKFAIANLDSTRSAQGLYKLTVDDQFGKFAVKFAVN